MITRISKISLKGSIVMISPSVAFIKMKCKGVAVCLFCKSLPSLFFLDNGKYQFHEYHIRKEYKLHIPLNHYKVSTDKHKDV